MELYRPEDHCDMNTCDRPTMSDRSISKIPMLQCLQSSVRGSALDEDVIARRAFGA